MAEDELRRVIEPFQQADTSTARRFGGTGLGLSICRDLIHLLGGVFMYASAPGRGTIFLFAIPCTVLQQQDAGGAGGAPLLGPAPLRPATLAPPAAHITERRSAPNTPRTSASPSDATSDAAPTAPVAPAAVTAVTSPTAPAPRQEASASSLRGRVVMVADDNPVNITDPASNHVVYIEAEGRVYAYLPQPCPCNRIGTVALGQLGSRSHAGRPHP